MRPIEILIAKGVLSKRQRDYHHALHHVKASCGTRQPCCRFRNGAIRQANSAHRALQVACILSGRDTWFMPAVVSKPALRVTGLRKAYQDVVAVNGLDLEVRAGECFGLLGPNGAGKTTTVEICEGLTAPDSGEVELLGMHWKTDADQLRQRLGIQLQDTQLSEKLTVYETLRLFRSFFDQGPDADEAIALVQLEEKKNSRVGNLSGGQKQRLALACALVGDPDFLFLDEPTTGLDPQARRQLWDLIEQFKSSGRTILLTTHYMDEAERLCERVAIMDNGKQIALGSPRELIASTCAEHLVAFSAGTRSDALDVPALRQIQGVRDVRSENGTVEMQVTELHLAVPALLAELTRQNIPLTELSTHSATLEDVFVSLTGRHLRDE
jgi:ABC-2 type transport system ATP-binding protein